MSRSKDGSNKLHEKHQMILADLLRDEDNKYCADCMAKGPRWASWNLGVFMCIRCAGIHRNLGVHISRVKSVNLDSWTPEQIESIQKGGNGRAKSTYEANLPANFSRPQDDYAVEQFIRAKYERKVYLSKGTGTEKAAPKQVVTAKESQESKAKSKPKKVTAAQKSSCEQAISVPRPAGTRKSPSPAPQPPKPIPSSAKTNGTIVAEASTRKPSPAVDLLTDLPASFSEGPSKKPSPQPPAADLLTASFSGTPSSSTPAGTAGLQPIFGVPAQQQAAPTSQVVNGSANAKDSIMSLYGTQSQPQLSSFTAQGYPVNSFYYQQQQEAAMRMAHISALQQHQVNQVTTQMQQIKIKQHQHASAPAPPQAFPGMSNGGMPGMGVQPNMGGQGVGGQTLNPTLW